MKKFLSLFLVISMLCCLTACGSKNNDVNNALQGKWVAKWTAEGVNISRYYSFKNDSYTTGGRALFGELDTENGTYKINGNKVVLTPDDGSEGKSLDYTYNEKSGELTLWWNDDVMFEKGNTSVSY